MSAQKRGSGPAGSRTRSVHTEGVGARGLDDIDRRIVGALQVDGRASWRRIADVLGVPFSTVTRRGSALLESGTVRVSAIRAAAASALFEVTVRPDHLDAVARLLARRPGATFVYVLAAPSRIVVEELVGPDGLASAVLDELPLIDGVTGVNAIPVLDYYRTVREWMPSLITTEEARRLRPDFGAAPPGGYTSPGPELDALDARIQELLVADGRVPAAEVAKRLGASETVVRKRIARLAEGSVAIRAVVEPEDIDRSVEALLWLQVAPGSLAFVASLISEHPDVRYAVMTMGDRMLLADVAVASLTELRSFLVASPWVPSVLSLSSSLVVRAYKRGGVIVEPRRP